MKSVKLKKIAVKHLCEIFQSLDIKFAYVNKKMEEVSVPAKCRDFLGDCIFSRKAGKSVGVYGFNYDYSKQPFDDCRFSLKFPNHDSYTNFINNISFLHEREKQAGVKLSKIFTTDDKSTLVIEGSNYWVSAIWKVSLYTFYLKLISYKTPTEVESPENKYLEKLTPEKEAKLLSKVKNKKSEEFHHADIYSVHNNYGFYSLLQGTNPNTQLVMES